MAENTDISWARHSFNAWIGCTKVSPACKFCYAERDWDHRFHRVQWGPKGPRSLTGPDSWKKPLRWNRQAALLGEMHSVFAFSLSDNMDDHPSIQQEWRDRFYNELVIPLTNLEWLMLTKRPENWFRFLPDWQRPLPNVRLGVSIEDQEWADIRRPHLKSAKMNGWKTFVSYGPACGPVDWDAILPWTDWLVAEGESGPEARPSHPDWFRQARDACARHGRPFHFKQWGEWAPGENIEGPPTRTEQTAELGDNGWHFSGLTPKQSSELGYEDAPDMYRGGIGRTGRLLDGVLHDAFPVAA